MADRYVSGAAGSHDSWRARLHADTHDTTAFDSASQPEQTMIPGLTVLYHPDLRRIGDRIALPELLSGGAVAISRLQPELAAPGEGSSRPLADSHLSRTPIRLLSAPGEELVIERGDHRGRVSVDGRPLEDRHAVALTRLDPGCVLVLSSYVALLLHWLDPVPTALPSFDLVGESLAVARLRQDIHRCARLDVPVLLRGETGTGKELVARALHRSGARAERDCVIVNMAAIPSSLAASELFGSVKGAFTGADRTKAGFFQRADGGTLFLDEIGETPLEAQALLLRALESHEVQPVGATSVLRVDVRVISATDADLDQAIARGEFRAPLLHRLAGYEIHLPTLRQRRDDVARLLLSFLRRELSNLGAAQSTLAKTVSLQLMVDLVVHPWPGNVRQLRNVARRLAILSLEGQVDIRSNLEALLTEPFAVSPAAVDPPLISGGSSDALPSQQRASPGVEEGPSVRAPRRRRTYRKPSEVNEEELLASLRRNAWNLKPTAEDLGISRASLYVRIEGCSSIRKAVDLTPGEIEAARHHAGDEIADLARRLEVSEQGLKRRMTQLGLR